eukprot:Skav223515  [mRNA]  locus=scaffold1160:265595:266642:+ [translate_table: standard]
MAAHNDTISLSGLVVGTVRAQAEAVEVLTVPKVKQDAGGESPEPQKDEHQLIVFLVAAAYVIWQMDKVNMSIAILPMATDFSWDSSEQGLIQSSIFWGYAATQVIGGLLATRFGGKRVLLFAVTLWSLATMLAPNAATVSTEVFIASRVCPKPNAAVLWQRWELGRRAVPSQGCCWHRWSSDSWDGRPCSTPLECWDSSGLHSGL